MKLNHGGVLVSGCFDNQTVLFTLTNILPDCSILSLMWSTYYPDNGRVGERQVITIAVLHNPTHKGGDESHQTLEFM